MASSDSVFKGLAYGGFASCLGDIATMPVDVTKVGEGARTPRSAVLRLPRRPRFFAITALRNNHA